MKRYRFSLDAVLRVRRAQEEAAGFALAQANGQRQKAIDAYQVALSRCRALVLHQGPLDHSSFRQERDVSERRSAAVTSTREAVAAATEVAAARHVEWAAAAKLLAAVEKLDERRREEWRLEQQRGEAAAIDESAIVGWLADAAQAASSSGLGARA
jgi:flagellar export protein FliJ